MNGHWSRSIVVTLVLSCGIQKSWAQDPSGVDLHGETVPLPSGHAADPVSTHRAPLGLKGAWGASLLGEFANDPARLGYLSAPGAEPESRPLLDGIALAHLGGWYAPSRRISVGGAVPFYFTAANYTSERPTFGDVYLRSELGLVLPDASDLSGPSVGLVPTLTVPTGNGDRLVGDEWKGEVSAVAGYRTAVASVHAHLGARLREQAQLQTQQIGGLQVPLGAAAGVRLIDPLWLHMELRGTVDPGSSPVTTSPLSLDGTPGVALEGMVSLTTRLGPVWSAGSLGTGLTSGIGAARSRGFFGVGTSYLPLEEPEERIRPTVRFQVVDSDGVPAEGAELRGADQVLARSDADGMVELAMPEPWPEDAQVVLPGHDPVELLDPPEASWDGELPVVELPEADAVVEPRVTDQGGAPVAAILTAVPSAGGDPRTGAPGQLQLGPGEWEVTVEAPGYAPQRRVVVVSDDVPHPGHFDVVLAPPAGDQEVVISVVDGVGEAVPDARVLVDGVPVGTVAEGALVALGGMGGDDVQVEVQHPAYTSVVVDVTPGSPQTIVLSRVPGTVKVIAVGPGGKPVDDAVVRFLGPSRLEPAPLGERGERVQVLSPGRWDVLVSSPSYGLQRRVIEVEPEQYELLEVRVQLQSDEGGAANLRVAVIDPEGTPVSGVQLHLDDLTYGETSSGGVVEVEHLVAGSRELWVLGDLLRPMSPRPVDLVPGLTEEVVPVQWMEGAMEVRVLGPEGPVTDAVLRVLGAGKAPEVLTLNADGMVRTLVEPGTWTVLASSPSLGLQQRKVEILAGSDILHRVDVVLTPPEGGLADLSVQLVDPDGAPVAGASVALDDIPLGSTGTGGDLRLEALGVGDRRLDITSELHEPWSDDLQLMEGEQTVEAELDWAPGVVRVEVTDGQRPLDDAVVRWLGPGRLPPYPVDDHGHATVRLAPGTWQILASSPTAGIAQQPLDVPVEASDRMDVTVVIQPPTVGVATLALRVVDPSGGPIEGAVVSAGGAELGTTGPGGLWLGEELAPGDQMVRVAHPAYGDVDASLALVAGAQERTVELPWTQRTVPIRVVDPAGQPVTGAALTVLGPVDVEAEPTDLQGRTSAVLVPGTWQIIATGGDYGPARMELVVGAETLSEVVLPLGVAELEVSEQLIAMRRQVLFGFGESELADAAGPVLDQVAGALLSGAVLRVEVQGHTDNVGGPAVNQALSEARARAVRDALVARGVPRETLVARGYGPQRPVADNTTEAGRAQNRRVAFAIEERAR